jgi:methionine--tRNA ligase beta chain
MELLLFLTIILTVISFANSFTTMNTMFPRFLRVPVARRILNSPYFCQQQSLSSPVATPPVNNSTVPSSSNSTKSNELEILEIRVGKIVEVTKHPEADSLYVEKVDVGEATGPRTIVSGLVRFCTAEFLLNRKVIVLCNLKPRPLKGVVSHGMLLCASDADKSKVSPLSPPEECPVGELVQFEGHRIAPAEAGNKATKAFSKIAEEFFVNENSLATFKNIPFMTSIGPISSELKGKIS